MHTHHRVIVGDARDLGVHCEDAVELVVTSPPYPMIELWDETFAALDPAIEDALAAGRATDAYDRMHDLLDVVWDELARMVVPGGIVCINVGDATRTVDGTFRRFPNHARITEAFRQRGFTPLPTLYWRKPTNAGTKFMGSGMLPPNAYVTQEHEHILVLRQGTEPRTFRPNATERYEAAYFWEERNEWFSDVWTDITGTGQQLDAAGRDRSAAYPEMVPYRLISMFSVYGDTVLDPFWGTGTTTVAAMMTGRHSIGVELDESVCDQFTQRLPGVIDQAAERNRERLAAHVRYVGRSDTGPFDHTATHYSVPVKTRQEREIRFYDITSVANESTGHVVEYEPVTDLPDDAESFSLE